MMSRLQQHWQAILAAYFPRWRAGSQWRCTTRTRRTAHGHCNRERQVIEIGFVSEDDDALDLLLVHEIAHAVTSGSHGKVWQRRIALAAVAARKLGRTRLAELLDQEIVNYQDRGEPVEVGYDEVCDALMLNPDLTLVQIKRWLAREYGLLLKEVGKVFPRLDRVYKTARKDALEMRKAHHQNLTPSTTSTPSEMNHVC